MTVRTTALLALALVSLVPGCPESTTPPAVDGGPMDAPVLVVDTGPAADVPGADVPGADAPSVLDAPESLDAPAPADDAPVVGTDAAGTDGGPMCGGMTSGSCGAGTTCECCPAGGPLERCVCTTACTTDTDCTDAARPICEVPPGATTGFCRAASFNCCWLCG